MDICADLHCHTNASDGKLSPAEVIRKAKESNVRLFAVTDHDTVDGLVDAEKESRKLGQPFVPGIELSCTHNRESIHVLGYFRGDGYKDESLIRFLSDLKESRISRALKIVENLQNYYNIKITNAEAEKLTKGLVARPHIANAIINSGYDYSIEYIFQNFIGNDCAAYVPNKHISVEEGTALLKSYGCIVVLAHPKLIRKTPVQDILRLGFDGIEAIYFQNEPSETKRFLKMAEEKNLLVTCGSDFHGLAKDDAKHGEIGAMAMPSEYLDKFIDALGCKAL